MTDIRRRCRARKGFTLIELLVVVLIIGILAAVAVPQYFKIVEKGRFSEGGNCLSTVKGAMERYNIKNGGYTGANTTNIDVLCPNTMKYFTVANWVQTANATGYTLTLARNTTGNSAYGSYTLTLNMPQGTMVCTSGTAGNCTDLLPP